LSAIPFEFKRQYPQTRADIAYLEDDLAWKEFHLRQTARQLGKVQVLGAMRAGDIDK